MNWWANRRNRLIAAQTVLVLVLCAAVYVGLLKPGTPGTLSGVTAPSGGHPPSHAHGHRGPSGTAGGTARTAGGGMPAGGARTRVARQGEARGGGTAAGVPVATAPSAGTASYGAPSSLTSGSQGQPGPPGVQYKSDVAELTARVGPAPAPGP